MRTEFVILRVLFTVIMFSNYTIITPVFFKSVRIKFKNTSLF